MLLVIGVFVFLMSIYSYGIIKDSKGLMTIDYVVFTVMSILLLVIMSQQGVLV